MFINLSPQVSDKKLVVSKKGDTLTINGVALDFSPLNDGDRLPAQAVDCDFVIEDVTRVNGDLQLTLLLPITLDAPEEATFPKPIVSPPDGKLKLPKGTNV